MVIQEKAKKEEMAVKEEMTKAKAKKEFWCESWRRKKEEKERLADEREEEVMARQREKHLLLVSPLDLDAQPSEASGWALPDVHERQQVKAKGGKVIPTTADMSGSQQEDDNAKMKHNSEEKEHEAEEDKGKNTNVHNVPLAESHTKRARGWSTVDGGGLRGGMEEDSQKDDPKFRYAGRPESWFEMAEVAASLQRPLPLAEPRVPDMEYENMTIDAIANEGGLEATSPQKDPYRRSVAQMEAIKEARRDQRAVVGGVYQCQRDDLKEYYLTIHRPYMAKTIAIVLERVCGKEKRTIFHSFFTMSYEPMVVKGGQRYRKEQPEETHTGFKWHGHGADQWPLPSSCVYAVVERVGETDLHFSSKDCTRSTEAPGASQSICSHMKCGAVIWHFARTNFDKKHRVTYNEEWADDFSLVKYKDGTERLVWRDQSGVQTFWARTESSEQFSTYKAPPGPLAMVEGIVKRGDIPSHQFNDPSFVPSLQPWKEQQPLGRQPVESQRKFVAAVLQALHLTPGRRLSPTVAHWLQFKLRGKGKDSFMATLSDLLRPNPWSYSLEDIAQMIGCYVDSDEKVLHNTKIILEAIVDRLAWSLDYKTADMALRHETHVVKNVTKQGCSHDVPDKAQLRYAPFFCLGRLELESGSPGALTVSHLQARIDACFETKSNIQACHTCGVENVFRFVVELKLKPEEPYMDHC